jgi:hypothetical protein
MHIYIKHMLSIDVRLAQPPDRIGNAPKRLNPTGHGAPKPKFTMLWTIST